MTKRKQRRPEFKSRVALEALKSEQTVADLVYRSPDDDSSVEEGAFRRGVRDLQHRPGQPVHIVGLDTAAEGGMCPHLDGWAWPVPRQHLHRTAVAIIEVRVRLPACLLGRSRGPSGDRSLDRLLKQPAPSRRAWWCDTGRCISGSTVGLGPAL